MVADREDALLMAKKEFTDLVNNRIASSKFITKHLQTKDSIVFEPIYGLEDGWFQSFRIVDSDETSTYKLLEILESRNGGADNETGSTVSKAKRAVNPLIYLRFNFNVFFTVPDGSDIFMPEYLQQVYEFQNYIISQANYRNYCWRTNVGPCQVTFLLKYFIFVISLMKFFFYLSFFFRFLNLLYSFFIPT